MSEVNMTQDESSLPQCSIKSSIILFILFMFVVSDIFMNNVITGFGDKAIVGRSLTPFGLVIQGVFLVFFYIIAIYLIGQQVI